MRLVADLHLHSSYSRATSGKMNAHGLSEAAKVKGLDLLGTGDFTHPKHLADLKRDLKPEADGLFSHNGVLFMLSAEIANLYTQDGRGRKVHHILLAPSFEIVDQINEGLGKWGRLDYDGRPMFGRTSIELVELCASISKDIEVIPAHAWTPWFSVFGSNSGFDSLRECYGERASSIHAIETGLSSDPAMNWRLSALDNVALVSFSDAHSPYPWRLGREATVFELGKPSYHELVDALRKKDPSRLKYTIEVDPAYGKYHVDGHRMCNVSLEPAEARKLNNTCPVCHRPLTIGVLHRVEELADRPAGFVPKGAIPFKSLTPLSEVIAAVYDTAVESKSVMRDLDALIRECGSELAALADAPLEKLAAATSEKVASAIVAMREGRICIKPGYDGVYGTLVVEAALDAKSAPRPKGQKSLGDF